MVAGTAQPLLRGTLPHAKGSFPALYAVEQVNASAPLVRVRQIHGAGAIGRMLQVLMVLAIAVMRSRDRGGLGGGDGRDGGGGVHSYQYVRVGARVQHVHTARGRPYGATTHSARISGAGKTLPFADVRYDEGSDPFVVHTVRADDTLEGILIRYRVTLSELKVWNAFPGRQYGVCKQLRIPRCLLPPGFVPQPSLQGGP